MNNIKSGNYENIDNDINECKDNDDHKKLETTK